MKRINNNKDNEINKLFFFIAYFITLYISIFLGYLLLKIPDKLDIDYIKKTYIPDIGNFVAEKSEFICYVVLTITFPLIFLVLYSLLRKKFNNIKIKRIKIINKVIFIISVIILTLLLIYGCWYYSSYTSVGLVIKCHLIMYILFVIFVIFFLFKYEEYKKIRYFLIFIVFVFIIWISSLFITHDFSQNGYVLHHFDAYYYPIVKIQNGLTPLVDFNSLYGNYSYVFAFILSFFSTDKMYIFSILCSLLIFISFGLFSFFSYKSINNKIIWFLIVGFYLFECNTIILYNYGFQYLQYIPHRIIFPMILLCYIWYYLDKKSEKIIYKVIGFIISSLALFWNFETGIFVLATWFLFLLYEILYYYKLSEFKLYKKDLKKIGLLLLFSIVFYCSLIIIITFIRTGKLLSLVDLIYGISIFSGNGFFMERMNLLHPWIVVVILYSVGITIAISHLRMFKKDNNNFRIDALYFVLSILGIGIFSYYQGRSVIMYFLFVIYPVIILLGMFLDNIAIKYKKVIILPIIILLSIPTFSVYYFLVSDKLKNDINSSIINENFLSFEEYVSKYKNIDFIVPYESWYYDRYKLVDKKPFPAYVDLFKYSDIEKIIVYMQECNNNIIMQYDIYDIIKSKYEKDYLYLINKKYDVIEKGREYVVFILKEDE